MFGSFPATAQAHDRIQHGGCREFGGTQALFVAHFRQQFQGPHALGLAERAWTLMQDRLEVFAFRRRKHRFDGEGNRFPLAQTIHTTPLKIVNHIAHGLTGTVHVLGNLRGSFPFRTRQQNLAASQGEGLATPQAFFQRQALERL